MPIRAKYSSVKAISRLVSITRYCLVMMMMMMMMMIMRVMMMIDDTYVVRVLSHRIPHDRRSGWCWVAFFLLKKKGVGWSFFKRGLGGFLDCF